MKLLGELGPIKYRPYVQVLEDSLTAAERQDAAMVECIEEINKERKFAQEKFRENTLAPLSEKVQIQIGKNVELNNEIGNLDKEIASLRRLKQRSFAESH